MRDHRVIAVDLPGHGDSEKPHEPTAYGPKLQAGLVALLDRLRIDKAHFVGFSMGANVVGDLVIANPDRVQTATLGSGFFTVWDESEEEFARHTEQRATSGERFPWEPENQDFQALAAVIRGARFSAVTAEQIADISTPGVVVYGSIEIDRMSASQRQRLHAVPGSMTLLILEGKDHDSQNAAILSTEFSNAVRNLIAANPI